MTGEATELDVTATGASRLISDEFTVDDADVTATGASTVTERATKELRIELSGASKCTYYGKEEDLQINSERVSGGSKVKHHK